MATERVLVKAFRGVALNRWLIGTAGDVAVITDDLGAAAVELGRAPEHSVGFPKNDIFVSPDRRISDGSTPKWEEMRPRF